MMEDPIFEPWSVGEGTPSHAWRPPASDVQFPTPVDGTGAADLLRKVARARLETIRNRLGIARHTTSVEDLLDEPARLLRFVLTPWPGPLPDPGRKRSAMLEIGLGAESDDRITAWTWLDRVDEAPDEVASVPSSKLTASWLERVIFDFVGTVLERS